MGASHYLEQGNPLEQFSQFVIVPWWCNDLCLGRCFERLRFPGPHQRGDRPSPTSAEIPSIILAQIMRLYCYNSGQITLQRTHQSRGVELRALEDLG